MISCLLALAQAQEPRYFDADHLLIAEGYMHNNAISKRYQHWTRDLEAISTYCEPLTSASSPLTEDYMARRNAHFEDLSQSQDWYQEQAGWRTFSGLPIGSSAMPPQYLPGSEQYALWAFAGDRVVHASLGIRIPRNYPSDFVDPFRDEREKIVEGWVRWRLSHLAMSPNPSQVLPQETLALIEANDQQFVSIKSYALESGYILRTAWFDSVLVFTNQSKRKQFTVYVGSDAVRVRDKTFYTHSVHPAVGKEVYLPSSFIEEHRL